MERKKNAVKFIMVKSSSPLSTNVIRSQIKKIDKKAVVGSGIVKSWKAKAGNC